MAADRVTVVVPVFNEGLGISFFASELTTVLDSIEAIDWTVLFVDDGSTDGTRTAIAALHRDDRRFGAVVLSRNFGKETAIAAGLRHATGDAVILMDGDMEHPPTILPAFVQNWRSGFRIVFGRRLDSILQSPLRRFYSKAFHRVFSTIAKPSVPNGAVDFLLMDRQAVDAMNRLGERTRFGKGLYAWIGFRSTVVPFDVGRRSAGRSSWHFASLAKVALDGFVSFSTVPLKVWSYLGLVISFLAIVYALIFIVHTLIFGPDVPGFPTLVVSIMFFSGVQLISLGVLGEYVARIYEEVKGRPLFLVDEIIGGAEAPVAVGRGGANRLMSVILCADDYAISEGVSRGIVELIAAGRLSATGVMVTERAWPRTAAALAPLAGRVAIGLHLNLTAGKPLGPMPNSLGAAVLPGIGGMIRRAFKGRLDRAEVTAEIERQLDRFEDVAGMTPDFIDGHHHVHVLPTIRAALLDAVVRRYRDRLPLIRDPGDRIVRIVARRSSIAKAMVIAGLATGFRAAAVRRGLTTNDGFAGFSAFDRHVDFGNEIASFLKHPGPRHLVMCHPGYPDKELRAVDGLGARRLDELDAIKSYPALDRMIVQPTRDRDGMIGWDAL